MGETPGEDFVPREIQADELKITICGEINVVARWIIHVCLLVGPFVVPLTEEKKRLEKAAEYESIA